eukprot:TRINITY_DN12621_c0_g1_i1.p1 TRINITY_DN12621_c0_g1~~TRINITY_DN12621_c0_g1_i1.p1  ORF type:complete len:383 (-),score=83.71 TRINITY_DN12621_c0_g1_i1:644-1792(-)
MTHSPQLQPKHDHETENTLPHITHEIVKFSDYYSLGEEIGRGSFSVVHRCTKKDTQETFAVKILDKITLGETRISLIQTEIDILRSIDHPNVISLEQVLETDTHICLIMELTEGGELFEKIMELQYYSERSAKLILAQVLSAVQLLHSKGIVHRDLKPENLFLMTNEVDTQVKLGDFGLATHLPASGLLQKAVGTPGYISPEALLTSEGLASGYGTKTDMWSIGIIMYNLLCGYSPFQSDITEEVFELTKAGKIIYPRLFWQHISMDAKDLLSHLLTLDPNLRYSAEEAMKHPWIASIARDQQKQKAQKHWKKGIHTILAMGRLQHKFEGITISSRDQGNAKKPEDREGKGSSLPISPKSKSKLINPKKENLKLGMRVRSFG